MDGNTETSKLQRRRRWPWTVGGGVIGFILAVAAWRAFGPGLPQINEADLQAARQRWQEHEVRNYDLTVVLSGRQTGTLHVEVRDGEPLSYTRNGTAMKDAQKGSYWMVPGMFETLETDFENAAQPADKFGSPDVRIVLRAEFDATYGFPRRYLHQIFGRLEDLSWQVTEFVPQ